MDIYTTWTSDDFEAALPSDEKERKPCTVFQDYMITCVFPVEQEVEYRKQTSLSTDTEFKKREDIQ